MLDDLVPNQPNPPTPGSSLTVDQPPPSESSQVKLPPPQGDEQKSEKYITQLISLVKEDKLLVFHTDLNKYSVDSIQDHYFVQLSDYEIEVSHSKNPDADKDFYIILFNNIKKIKEGCSEKAILAYIHIAATQFNNFKTAADNQIEKKRREAEAKRFTEAMEPIDNLLENFSSQSGPIEVKESPKEATPKLSKLEDISVPEEKPLPDLEEVVLSQDNPETPPSIVTA